MLTPEQVHIIRTSGIPDAQLARQYGVIRNTVRWARIGDTWKDHPTPPDTKPRVVQGKWNV